MSDSIEHTKAVFKQYRAATYDCDESALRARLATLLHPDCVVRLAHPMGDTIGPEGLMDAGFAPLIDAIPDLERRDNIVIGAVDGGEHWIATAGSYMGVFEKPWLGIPATRGLVSMRYLEFYRFEESRIRTARMLWDVPALMMQAKAWPLAPSLGIEFNVPGPATQDGIIGGESDPTLSAASMKLVDDMIVGLGRFAEGGTQAMQLEKFWHPRMNWYGPAGIGSCRRLSGFRNWHQIPFLSALPDRQAMTDKAHVDCYFADGNYVAFCGWPAMKMRVTGDGWLGIAPAGQELSMASLDLWRCENGKIRENWVMIDLLDIYRQLGVDVMRRMREVTFDRQATDFQT